MNTKVKTGRTKSGRRFIEWVYRNYTPEMALRNLQRIRVSYYINFFYSDILRNNETGAELEFYHHTKTRLIKTRAQARNFLNEQTRDSNAKPNTKWQFVRSGIVNVKVTFTRQPLMGVGLLPQWLRTLAEHGHHMYRLDTYNDNLCLWRCIAVHRGARHDRATREAKAMARRFYKITPIPQTPLENLWKVENFLNSSLSRENWQTFRVFEPQDAENWRLIRPPVPEIRNVITLGFYDSHVFYIKRIEALARIYECQECGQRFTHSRELTRHRNSCKAGQPRISCPGQKVKKLLSKHEMAFYESNTQSAAAIEWLESESKRTGLHIHHARCGHGGEKRIAGNSVDGYEPTTNTAFEYYGCFFHGCPRCFPTFNEKLEKT